jgi:hypothetical protein
VKKCVLRASYLRSTKYVSVVLGISVIGKRRSIFRIRMLRVIVTIAIILFFLFYADSSIPPGYRKHLIRSFSPLLRTGAIKDSYNMDEESSLNGWLSSDLYKK